MNLTAPQLQFFDTFGFLEFPGLLAKEADAITEAFEAVWAAHGGGHDGQPHDHKQRSALVPFIDQHEYLCGLLDDPRIEGIGSALLGDDFNYTGSDGNYYVGDTRWHSDGYRDKKYVSLKMAFYLDPVTRDTGCLRVVPGSHRFGDAFAEALEAGYRHTTGRGRGRGLVGRARQRRPGLPAGERAGRFGRLQSLPQAQLVGWRHAPAYVHDEHAAAPRRGRLGCAARGHRLLRPLLGRAGLRRGDAADRRPGPDASFGAAPRQRRTPRRALSQGPRRDERAKPRLRIAIGCQPLP